MSSTRIIPSRSVNTATLRAGDAVDAIHPLKLMGEEAPRQRPVGPDARMLGADPTGRSDRPGGSMRRPGSCHATAGERASGYER